MALLFYQQYYDLFNNFSANAVEFEGILYPTSEHAYQAAHFDDPGIRFRIAKLTSPGQAQKLTNTELKPQRRADWEEVKLGIMEEVLRAKLAQHPEVREALLQSGDEEIVEDSPTDSFWGRGSDGNGQNNMGKLWMKLRSELS